VLPLPLKVFVISAGAMRTRLGPFLTVILVARVVRYFGEAYVGIQLGEHSMEWFKAHVGMISLVAVLFCAIVYAVVRWRDSRVARRH
jgi:membrane protein DedA with SNARE-associated domain